MSKSEKVSIDQLIDEITETLQESILIQRSVVELVVKSLDDTMYEKLLDGKELVLKSCGLKLTSRKYRDPYNRGSQPTPKIAAAISPSMRSDAYEILGLRRYE